MLSKVPEKQFLIGFSHRRYADRMIRDRIIRFGVIRVAFRTLRSGGIPGLAKRCIESLRWRTFPIRRAIHCKCSRLRWRFLIELHPAEWGAGVAATAALRERLEAAGFREIENIHSDYIYKNIRLARQ